ncbi:MAG: hypothetical protein AVDCRST_MAG01-01-3078, partial [uncultured Rubrobacteraceae bacterium]
WFWPLRWPQRSRSPSSSSLRSTPQTRTREGTLSRNERARRANAC